MGPNKKRKQQSVSHQIKSENNHEKSSLNLDLNFVYSSFTEDQEQTQQQDSSELINYMQSDNFEY